MIKIENTDVYGFESAIRGMRNPMNSWDKSDSGFNADTNEYEVGINDYTLMKKLVNAGSDHSKFMRMLVVTFDITAPLYWWKEFDTYKVGTVRNSCSTMHKIMDHKFTEEDFCFDVCGFHEEYIIEICNQYRVEFLLTGDKVWWRKLIKILPSAYMQRSTIQLNYAVLRNMYHSRKNHKLSEWHEFCDWIVTLPYSELITI